MSLLGLGKSRCILYFSHISKYFQMFWFGFNKNLKYILPSAFSINYSIHLYFKGNSVHMFLIHLALTHQNIVSSSAIFCPKRFSSPLLLFLFLRNRKRYSLPKANPSKLPKSLLNIASRIVWVWKFSVSLSQTMSSVLATLSLSFLAFSFPVTRFALFSLIHYRFRFPVTKGHGPADTLILSLDPFP